MGGLSISVGIRFGCGRLLLLFGFGVNKESACWNGVEGGEFTSEFIFVWRGYYFVYMGLL